MIDYREILRLKSLDFINVEVANSIHSSRNKFSEVLTLGAYFPFNIPSQNLLVLFDPVR